MAWGLDKIVTAFGDAAADPSLWNAAMEIVSIETGAYGAALIPVTGRIPVFPRSTSVAGGLDDWVSTGWIHRCERYRTIPAILRNGVATDLDALSIDEIRRNEYYQDFLTPRKMPWFAGVRIQTGDDFWALTAYRDREPFQPDELDRLARLSTQISSAAALARALGFARAEGALTAFDLSATAAIMLGSNGDIIKINRRAESILGRDIAISNRRLRSKSKPVSDQLDKMISMVLGRADCPAAPAIPLPRGIGRPMVAYVLRSDSVCMEALSPSRAMIILCDPDREIVPAVLDLVKTFGLTRSEATLVIELQRGLSLIEAAQKINITYETSRTTLKQIFRKTETKSQADLLLLVSRLRHRTSQLGVVER